MPKKYDFKAIEKKHQAAWEKSGIYRAKDFDKKPKFYPLVEFPYPSGAGLHVGHVRSYTALDILARKRRMQGYNVLYPMGWDAFGLPTENYAVKTGIHPAKVTKDNADTFRRQLKAMGFSFDWSREINTTDPEYYRWTQWIFIQLYNHGLAYKAKSTINWCPSCKIGLANEEVVAGKCERCGSPVEEREKEQWMLKITKYADKLLEGLETVDFLPRIRNQQENWIGRKEGINIRYSIDGISETVSVFTTRPDTNFGATFVVLAPENPLVEKITTSTHQRAVAQYVAEAKQKSEEDRIAEGRKKTGVFTGRYAINHLTQRKMPIWVSDFVLGGYGTGAVVGVPAHDVRDFEFAKEFGLEIIRVVVGKDGDRSEITRLEQVQEEEGTMINSGFLDGMEIHEATQKIMDHMVAKGWGERAVSYHLRDWIFSRQRYWGEPIPMIYCESCYQREAGRYNYVLLHGYQGSPNSNFFPWLGKELEHQGHSVDIPKLPNPQNPNVSEQVKYVLNNCKFDENTIILGHSLGSVVALKVLEQLKTPVLKTVLAAGFAEPKFHDRVRPFENKFDWKFNFNKIMRNAGEVVLLRDSKDTVIRPEQIENLKKWTKGKIVNITAEEEHICGEVEPEVLKACIITRQADSGKTNNPGWFPVPKKSLPIKLPDLKDFKPRDDGESPLANAGAWLKVKCPECGGAARRETDVMPNWAGSSWYFLAYTLGGQKSKVKSQKYWDQKKLKYWMPVDWYNGGMEHTTLHLLYSRFWNQFLCDIGVVPVTEPYAKRTSHGMVLGEGGIKMSKSKGNVLNPDDVVKAYGADTLRLYEMFMGPFDQAIPWDPKSIEGVFRFLSRIWNVHHTKVANVSDDAKKLEKLLNKTIKKVSEDIEAMGFNTAVSTMMIFVNACQDAEKIPMDIWRKFLLVLAPFAPHLAEELWQQIKNQKLKIKNVVKSKSKTTFQSVHSESWPEYDPKLIQDETFTLIIQVNGKVRDQIEVPAGIGEGKAKELALASDKIQTYLSGQEPKKIIYVPGRLVNLVI